ncbi:Zinc finger C2H2-type protein [Macrophomina phaseolina MS6]|uniref:Zinc finger C2H2-type protein n=1 Tax=Macrophomina phaseolina (strain MS6) TaxID=1126212 RepID=K2S7S5_MACPH|nr:Zinc finger C2H2-type protein [Macrophomina phaseolina MS6]
MEVHALPVSSCPLCFDSFPDEDELARHRRNTSCQGPKPPPKTSFSIRQKESLVQVPKRRISDEEKWKEIWRILFPDLKKIPSPYFDENDGRLSLNDLRRSDHSAPQDQQSLDFPRSVDASHEKTEPLAIGSCPDNDATDIEANSMLLSAEDTESMGATCDQSVRHFQRALVNDSTSPTEEDSCINLVSASHDLETLDQESPRAHGHDFQAVPSDHGNEHNLRASPLQQCQASLSYVLPLVESPEVNDLVGAHVAAKDRVVFARVMVALKRILNLDSESPELTDDNQSLGDGFSQAKLSDSSSHGAGMFPTEPPVAASCLTPGFRDISRLKEHLYRRHKLPENVCFVCFRDFPDLVAVHEHLHPQIGEAQCLGTGNKPRMNFTRQQERQLRQRSERSLSDEEKWKCIFITLFYTDGERHPALPSPYNDADYVFEVPDFSTAPGERPATQNSIPSDSEFDLETRPIHVSLRRFQPQGVQARYTAPALPIQHNELGVILDPRVSPVVMDTVSGKQVAAPQLGNYANYNLPFFPYYDQQHNLGNGIATIPLSGQASASSSYFMTVSNAPTLDHRTLQNFSNPQFMLAGHIPRAGALQGKQYHTVHEEQMEGDDQGLNQSMIDPIGFDAIDTVHTAMSTFSTSSTRATGMPESDFESSQVQNADLTSTQATTLGSEASVQDKE